MTSSLIPSLKYSCSESPLMLAEGQDADRELAGRRSGRVRGRAVAADEFGDAAGPKQRQRRAERAREWIERALLLDPNNMVMRYNFACTFASRLKDADSALAMLGPVVEKATPPFLDHVKVDPDLDPIRDDPRFQAMIAGAEARLAAGEAR